MSGPAAMARGLTFSVEDARQILAYDRAVFDRFVHKVRRLPKREAHREREIGHHSLFRTLVHVLNVHEAWQYLATGRARQLDRLFQDPTRQPNDWKGFDAYATRVWAEVDRGAAALTPAALDRRVRAWWMPGTYTVRDALLQVTLEEAHHLGEVIGALWQDDRASPPMTWIEVTRVPTTRRRRRA